MYQMVRLNIFYDLFLKKEEVFFVRRNMATEILNEALKIAKTAWENSPLNGQIIPEEQMQLGILAENLVRRLAEGDFPGQPLDRVYFDKQVYEGCAPRVEVLANGQGVNRFWPKGGFNSISFETHPEWKDEHSAKLRWLIVSGSDSEQGLRTTWQTSYRFDGFSVVKQDKRLIDGKLKPEQEEKALNLADLNLVEEVLVNLRTAVDELVYNR